MLVHWGKCNASLVRLITNHCFNKQDISPQIFDLTFTKNGVAHVCFCFSMLKRY